MTDSSTTAADRGLRPAYELVAQEIRAAGVAMASGLIGEDTSVLTSELEPRGVAYRTAKHENVAVNIADGYSWARSEMAATILGRGPGMMNAAPALATLVKGRRQVIVVSTQPAEGSDPSSDPKAIDQQAFATALGLEYVAPRSAPEVIPSFRQALACARSGRPALFALPLDLVAARLSPLPPPEALAPPSRVAPSSADVDRLLALIEDSDRPLVLAGAGALDARDELAALAERIGGLLGTSLVARDLFRDHRLDLGVIGGLCTETARELLRDVDCVFGFGASLNIFTRGHGLLFAQARVVAVDHDPTRLGASDAGIVGDARFVVQRLLERLPAEPRRRPRLHRRDVLARIAARRVWDRDDEATDRAVDPRALSSLLDEVLPANRQVITDAGHFAGFPAVGIRGPGPGTFRQTAEALSVGMGLGTAIGAAMARPSMATVLAIGDGGLAMTLGDLEPLARFKHPIIVIVYNDQAYGAERHYLDLDGRPHAIALLDDVDFARVAEGMGIEGATVRSLDDVRRIAPRLSHRRSSIVVDCKINPAVRARVLDDLNTALPKRVASGA